MNNRHINIFTAVALLAALASLPFLFIQQSRQVLTLHPPAVSSAVAIATPSPSSSGQVLGLNTEIPEKAVTASTAQPAYVNPFGGNSSVSSQPAPTSAASVASAQFDALIAPVMAVQSAHVGIYPRGFTYPMAELGGCASQQDCFRYCQISSNLDICQRLAVINGLSKPFQQSQVLGAATDASSELLQHCSSYADCVSYCQSRATDTNCQDLQKVVANATENSGSTQYSFPALDQYFANAKNQATGQPGPGNVLAANINVLPSDQAVQDCINNSLGQTNPVTGLPINPPNSVLLQQQQQCQDATNNYAQSLSDSYQQQTEAGKQSSTNSIFSLQQCITKSKDLASDLQACLQGQAE